jgi:DNA-binding MarR family transcriptional regulator
MVRRKPRRLRRANPEKRAAEDLRALVDETVALFHRLAWVAEQIYGEEGRSTARRGILRGLLRYGPQTVPELARARSVRRQTLQPVVRALCEDGLVELIENERHLRSPLARITTRGEALVLKMDRIDAKVISAVGRDMPARDIEVTSRTLRELRERFETSVRWRAIAAAHAEKL